MFRIIIGIAFVIFGCAMYASKDPAEWNSTIKNMIGKYALEYKYSPFSSDECPQEIAEFIGGGEQIIVLATPLLPTLLSAQFKHVIAVHTSSSQLRFTVRLHKAFLAGTINSLINGIERNFIDIDHQNLLHPTSIHNYFQNIFAPIMNRKKENFGLIKAEFVNILCITPASKSTLFLSTYLEQQTDATAAFETITQWLTLGHEVVFTQTSASPDGDSTFISPIRTLHNSHTITSKKSTQFPGTKYHKISPN